MSGEDKRSHLKNLESMLERLEKIEVKVNAKNVSFSNQVLNSVATKSAKTAYIGTKIRSMLRSMRQGPLA